MRQKALNSFEVLKSQLHNLDDRMQRKLDRQPDTVPQGQSPVEYNIKTASSGTTKGKLSTPVYRSSNGRAVESPVGEPGDDELDDMPTPNLTSSEIRKIAPTLFMPSIEHITAEELDSVPKYMRGRLTLGQVNAAADEINKALNGKYALMRTSKAKMTDHVRAAIRAYNEQIIPETKGLHFVVEGDIANLSHFKLDKSGRNIMVLLRHCSRIREVRGGGLTRYVIV